MQEKQGIYDPYIIEVTNTSNNPINNIKLFDAQKEINNPYFAHGQDLNGVDYTIKTKIAEREIGYRDLLTKIVKTPIDVALIYVEYEKEPEVWSAFSIQSSHDPFLEIQPKLENGQKTKNIACCKVDLLLDAYSKMIVSVIPPKTTVTYHFYPIK